MFRRVREGKGKGLGGRSRRGIGPDEGVGVGEAQGVVARRVDCAVLSIFTRAQHPWPTKHGASGAFGGHKGIGLTLRFCAESVW